MINLIAHSLLFITLILTTISSSSSAFYGVDTGLPPPPVDIEIAIEGIPRTGEQIELKITVTPQEDILADISCLLPEGIIPLPEEGKTILLRPWMNNAVELWVGPLKANTTQEFILRVILPEKGRYEFTVRIESFEEKYGVKEDSFVIDIN